MKHNQYIGIIVAAACVLASCSVKEDRVPCPAYLNVSFTDRDHIDTEVGLLGWNAAELFRDTIDVADYDPYWVKPVKKGTFFFSAYRNKGTDAVIRGHYVQSPAGNQADSLYAYHTEVEAVDENAYVDVTFKKQFCTVYLDIRRSSTEMQEFSFKVNGNTCGFDVLSFEAVPGIFNFTAVSPAGERVVPFRIYRQVDDSISVVVYRGGAIIGTYPLGEYIARMGYNWDAEDLQDIYVVVDLVMGQITISVEGWEEGMSWSIIEQ